MLFDERKAEQITQPCQHSQGARVADLAEGLGERFPLQEFGMGLGRFDEFVLVLVEQRGALVLGSLLAPFSAAPTSATMDCTRSVSSVRWPSSSRSASAAFWTEPVSATNWATCRSPVR